jgi:glucokinase
MNYLKKGLVLECGRDTSSGGRRPELLRLNLQNTYIAGLDIGPEKIVAIITDLALKPKVKTVIPRPRADMDKVMESAVDMLEKLFKDFAKPLTDIKLIGIGASGIVDIGSGTLHDTDPSRGRTKTSLFRLVRLMEEKFKITSLFGNDATCAAFGELSLNPDTDIKDMLYVYSDIGCGIIINRDIYCGTTGGAGEIQLLINNTREKVAPSELASYGVKGIDLGIVTKAKAELGKGEDSIIPEVAGGREAITKEAIFAAAQKEDKLARALLANAAYWLGIKVAYLINVFNPQAVIIGGGMEKAGSLFMQALTSCVKMYAFEESFGAAKVLPSFLGEEAIAVGAASLGIRELFINA